MYRPRFSLRSLLGLFVFVAVGCASLLRATPLIAAMVCGATLLLLLAAVPLCVYRSGGRRAFWLGFALFGLAYYIVVCGPWLSPGTDLLAIRLRDQLPTTQLLQWTHSRLPTKPAPNGGGMFGGGGGFFQFGGGMGGPISPVRVPIAEWSDFATVGHALWSIMIALAGGAFTSWCQRGHRGD